MLRRLLDKRASKVTCSTVRVHDGSQSWMLTKQIMLQVGAYEDKPAKIAEVVRSWVHEKKPEFDAMAVRAKQMGQPHAVFRIVEDLAAMCA